MIEAFSPGQRIRTFVLLLVAAALAVVARVVGIDDNPLGISLVMLAGASFVLAFVHPWRTPARFWRLTYLSAIGFLALMVLGIASQALLEFTSLPEPVDGVVGFVGTAFLLAAGFLLVPAFVVGVLGTALTRIRPPRQG